jgi:hypothetical protein
MKTKKNGDMETWSWRHVDIKRKTEAQAIFRNLFTVRSSCKLKLVVCLFVDDEAIGCYYQFENGLNGLAHLWVLLCINKKLYTLFPSPTESVDIFLLM